MSEQPSIKEAASALVLKLEAIHESQQWKGVWGYLAAHDYRYTGPCYDKELMALKSALVLEAVFTPLEP